MSDLFAGNKPVIPLAEALRPTVLEDFVGQKHLLASNKPLGLALRSCARHSMILWGPPGVGKTTLARLLAQSFDGHWFSVSAVSSGVTALRAALERARHHHALGQATWLFVDEIHRLNTAQQDALLPDLEQGVFYLIGATTENPSFEVNAALLSRSQVYSLQALTAEDLQNLLARAEVFLTAIPLTEEARTALIRNAEGDARRLLNSFEQCQAAARAMGCDSIDLTFLQSVLASNAKRFDKGGDHFYDQVSALHKSVRGSNPDAALYWLCSLLESGADPRYVARRIIRMAWEDIGLADPRALHIAQDAALAFERLGSPEGELALGQAVLYLAVAAKSNAGYVAYTQARAFVQQDISRSVPLHLRNAPTALMKEQGCGQHYRYAHDEPNAYAAGACYLPDGMPEPHWYQPVDRGLESKIAEKLQRLRRLDQNASAKKMPQND